MYFACDRKSESKSYLKFIQMVSAIVVTDHHSPKQCQRKGSEGQQFLSEYFSRKSISSASNEMYELKSGLSPAKTVH